MTDKSIPIAAGSIDDVIKLISSRVPEYDEGNRISVQEKLFGEMGIDSPIKVGELNMWIDLDFKTDSSLNFRVDCEDLGGHFLVECDWSDPMNITVTEEWQEDFDRYGSVAEDPDEFLPGIDELSEVLKEFFSPDTHPKGFWWADENYYPIRPLLDGEDPSIKPEKNLTVVNASGDVVAEVHNFASREAAGRICKTMKKTIKLTESRLRQVIREELLRQKLGALYEDAALGGMLHKAVTHLWQADNVLGQAVQHADQDHHDLVSQLKAAVEKMAFDVEAKATSTERGEVKSTPKAPPSKPGLGKPAPRG